MNQRKAKALRNAANFNPNAEREYNAGNPGYIKALNERFGETLFQITGTITALGRRSTYQKIKRNSGLGRIILKAAA